MTKAKKTLPKGARKEFENLLFRLEPEVLHCDGEATRAEVNAKIREINRQWKKVQAMYGTSITIEEMEDIQLAELRAELENYKKGILKECPECKTKTVKHYFCSKCKKNTSFMKQE